MISADLNPELEKYLAGILAGQHCHPVRIAAQPDHVHLLFLLGRTNTIADIVRDLKSSSTRWLQQHEGGDAEFSWQRGYGAFSVSESNIARVINYVANQDKHHEKLSFQDEFRRFCSKHGVELDERYAWD